MRVLILSTAFLIPLCSLSSQETITPRQDSPIVKGLPIKCSGVHYTWTGMLRDHRKKNNHTLKTTKNINPTPLEVIILEKADALMVDNEQFKILRTNAKETLATLVNENNLITILLNYRYGTVLYNKVFTNVDVGIQNAMNFVAACRNY